MTIMKMCGNDRRRYGKYNGNNENDNSISLRPAIKRDGFLLISRKKKGLETAREKFEKILKCTFDASRFVY